VDDKKKGCFGCLGIIIVAFIVVFIIMSNATKEEKLTEEEITTINNTISEFEKNTIPYIESTNGIVKRIKMFDVNKSDDFYVHVYIDELGWAKSTESEKMSIATTIGSSMKMIAGDLSIDTFIISATNDDVLAEPSGSSYKIKR